MSDKKRYFLVTGNPAVGFNFDLNGCILEYVCDKPELGCYTFLQPEEDAKGKPMAKGGVVSIDYSCVEEITDTSLQKDLVLAWERYQRVGGQDYHAEMMHALNKFCEYELTTGDYKTQVAELTEYLQSKYDKGDIDGTILDPVLNILEMQEKRINELEEKCNGHN